MPMNSQCNQLTEGLRPLDLQDMIRPIFEIDSYSSKMGEDRDVCVISFNVRDRSPAVDLMEFIEKGFHYVLDADVSAGESSAGEYSVFVELPRSSHLGEHIKAITYGVRKLTGIDDFQFKYHKDDNLHLVSEDNLNMIPESPELYDGFVAQFRTEGIREFFNKTLMDDFTRDGNIITIHKQYGSTIKFELVNEGTQAAILEGITDGISIDDESMSEVFWLTKVMGNYDINKIGNNFIFNNGDQSMMLRRL